LASEHGEDAGPSWVHSATNLKGNLYPLFEMGQVQIDHGRKPIGVAPFRETNSQDTAYRSMIEDGECREDAAGLLSMARTTLYGRLLRPSSQQLGPHEVYLVL
jgi:hypothetical protein